LGVELSGQLIITSIASGGKAERSGLRVGDRVVNLNGIDAAHLSLIDAAYILRRQQSDVTLMRVEHEDGEETLARLYNTESPTRVYENLREPAPPLYHHQHQHHTCCCHTHLAQGRQSVECGHPRERPPASHTCIISPCVEESEFEERGIIGRCPKLSAADAVHCTQCHSGQTRVVTWIGDRADPIDSFASQPGRFARLTDEVDSSTPVGPFLAHGRTPDGTIPMTAGSTTAATVAMTDSMAEGKHRVVNVTRHPLLGTGIRLIGGNAVGLFISDVNPQSSAAAAGIVPGDEILAINDEKVNDMTKADAALRILGTPVALKLELKRNTTKYFNFLDELLGPGDDFYVRAAFSLSPLTDLASYGADEQVPALPITCGDIFHVTDSLYNGSFSSWLVSHSTNAVLFNLQAPTYHLMPLLCKTMWPETVKSATTSLRSEFVSCK
uniref:PDZ domain-containing protein n=1 Tax=Schistocephalus solidus TaxID=70667 RepID=A0A183TTJ6_SCHSO